MTVPQTRALYESQLHRKLAVHCRPTVQKRLERKVLARFYAWAALGLLAPLELRDTG